MKNLRGVAIIVIALTLLPVMVSANPRGTAGIGVSVSSTHTTDAPADSRPVTQEDAQRFLQYLQQEDFRVLGPPPQNYEGGPLLIIPQGQNPCPRGGRPIEQVHTAHGTFTRCQRIDIPIPPPQN